MKNKQWIFVSIGLLASCVAQAAEIYNKDGNKLELYGRVKASHFMSDSTALDGDWTSARLGFRGNTQINDALSGYGQWEYQMYANTAEGNIDPAINRTRYAFAGLSLKTYGSFDYGRNAGVMYNVGAYTDMLPEFGGDGFGRVDNFMAGRSTGLATYRNNDFFGVIDGLNLTLQYQGKNENRSVAKQNGEGFGVSVEYELGDSGFSTVAAYTQSDRTQAQQAVRFGGGGSHAEAWAAGMRYSAHSLYLGTIYGETRNMTPILGAAVINGVNTPVAGFANLNQALEMVVQYQFDAGFRPSLAYIQSRLKDVEGVGDADLTKYVDASVYYFFNKNLVTYVDYKINLLDEENSLHQITDDVLGLGIVYQF